MRARVPREARAPPSLAGADRVAADFPHLHKLKDSPVTIYNSNFRLVLYIRYVCWPFNGVF